MILLGTFFIFVLGSLGHFVYEWSGYKKWASYFFSINESTWEHMKLVIFPYLLWIFITSNRYIVNYNFWFSHFIGLFTTIIMIPTFYYIIKKITGKNILIVHILEFFISVLLGQIAFNLCINSGINNPILGIFGIVLICIITLCFFIFTFKPPHIFLFKDPITEKYGLN